MAEAEIGDLIIEVRSATAGVGSFTFTFDHMAELTGRQADQIVAARKNAAGRRSFLFSLSPLWERVDRAERMRSASRVRGKVHDRRIAPSPASP